MRTNGATGLATTNSGVAQIESAPAPRGAGRRRGGRPPTLSREQILDAALEIARQTPDAPVSRSAVARSLSVTPMALYTYFANRDELMEALSAKLLEGFSVDVSEGKTPVERIVIWARALRQHCLDHPQLPNLLIWEGGRSSAAWLNKSQPLFDAAQALGYQGVDLGRVMLWLWSSIMTAIRMDVLLTQTGPTPYDEAALVPAVKEGVRMVHLAAEGADNQRLNFEFELAQVIAALSPPRR